MKRRPGIAVKNYFAYLPPSPREEVWGASVTALGFSRVAPGGAYPVGRHPDDHHFSWERGRVLEVFQMVAISDGAGVLEMGRPGQSWPVTGGQVFILFPGVWHRYAPDPKTGWVEHWLECRGRSFTASRRLGLLTPARPLVDLRGDTSVLETMMRCHDLASQDPLGSQDVLASLAVHALCLVAQAAEGQPGRSPSSERRIQRARQLILDRSDAALDVAALARDVGMGYSHFRQTFQKHCGQGAREFHAQVRMRRACDLLHNTDLAVKEIGEMLGFSSAFHFSASFKAAFKVSPTTWRQRRIVE